MFARIHLWSHLALGFCFGGDFFVTVSILVLVIGLFIISTSSWFSLQILNFSKNLSISSRLSILLVYEVKLSESLSVMSEYLQPHGLYSPWNSPNQKTRVGSLSLLQGIFPTQGSNPGLPHCRWILYQLSHKGSPHWHIVAHNSLLWSFVCLCLL